MATVIWSGATDGNFGTNGNYVGGTAPSTGDTVVFDRGNVDVNAGLTSGLTNLTIVGTPEYGGRIAPGANSLNAGFASIRWAAGSANFSGNVTTGKFEPRNGATIGYVSGTMTNAFFRNAIASISAAAIVTNLRAWGGSIDDLYNATAYALAEIGGSCLLNSKRGGKIIAKAGGVAKVLDAGVLSTASAVDVGGLIRYMSSAAISGTVDVLPTGRFDASQNATAFDFSSGTLNVWPGGGYNLDTKAGTVDPGTLSVYGLSSNSMIGGAIPAP